jgi:hypothetical protein
MEASELAMIGYHRSDDLLGNLAETVKQRDDPMALDCAIGQLSRLRYGDAFCDFPASRVSAKPDCCADKQGESGRIPVL